MLLWAVFCAFTLIFSLPRTSFRVAHATSAATSQQHQSEAALPKLRLSTSLPREKPPCETDPAHGAGANGFSQHLPGPQTWPAALQGPAGLEGTASPRCPRTPEGFLVLGGMRKALWSP